MRSKLIGIYKNLKFEYKIGIVYSILGFLWIYLSDTLINSLSSNKEILSTIQTFKGSFYILITTILLIYLVKRHMKKMRDANLVIKQRTDEIEAQNEEYKQLNEELQNAKEKAEESDRLKSAFLQNMSHEVRTPLNAIVGFSQFIAKPGLPQEKYAKYAKHINESSDKLIEIITDVVEISQVYAKIQKVKTNEFDLVELLTNIVNKYKQKAIEKNIRLELKFNITEEKFPIKSDYDKIKQIIKHLLDNAVKFTIKGSVEINCLMNKNEIALSFTDTGIGIPQELQKKVFEPFRQVETGMCRTFGGNGLGLPIVKAYIELLNGTVTLKSELEKGTNITVCIPLLQTSSLPLPENVIHQTTAVHTILIAEDEYSNYAYLKELLSSLNFKIVYAENGLKAVELCQSIPEIDLVLMDIKMPIMDGLTAAKKIREFRPELLILAQTAYALESEKDSCMYLFNDYITKPIKLDLLTEKLQKYLNK